MRPIYGSGGESPSKTINENNKEESLNLLKKILKKSVKSIPTIQSSHDLTLYLNSPSSFCFLKNSTYQLYTE